MMWLPSKLYESLPVLYMAVGALLLTGSIYIGINHGAMPAYVALGVSSILGGLFLTFVRYRARSHAEPHSN